ncbi:MAG: hypothetical protein WDN30_14125 [Pararobbsia sp.]
MSGISTLINSTAGAINGYRDQTYQQNAQDYLQQVRANDQLKMLAAQTTYQPQAQAQIAQAGLSQLQANSAAGLIPQESADAQLKMLAAQTTYQPQAQAQIAQAGLSQLQANSAASLIPQQTGVASTQLQTAQTAADGALQRQPAINQAAANQATVQAGVTGTQAQMLPQQQTDMQLQRAQADQQQHVSALTGLYTSMMEGPSAAKAYVQKVADSGAYPGLQGKQIGTVGLTSDGQNFAATDTQGNEVFQIPTSSIQSAFKMSRPTEWHEVKPGSTLIGTQGGNISTSTQAPVPDAFSNQHAGVTVNTANWLMKNVPNLKAQDAFNMAKASQHDVA